MGTLHDLEGIVWKYGAPGSGGKQQEQITEEQPA